MTPELEKLIDLALVDGQLTEKEKQVLFKKAEALGVDLDEFEMVLDAKLFQATSITTTTTTTKTEKIGEIKKCPSCGSVVAAFSSSCSDCGFEFRNVGANSSVKLISEKLEAIIADCNRKSFEDPNIIGKLADTKESQEERRQLEITKRQSEAIRNFPIPNTKDDILELLHFIYPKTRVGFSSDKNTTAWRNKFSEILSRAKVAFANDKRMLAEIEQYERSLNISIFSKLLLLYNGFSSQTKAMMGLVLMMIIMGGALGVYSFFENSEIKTENNRLKAIEKEIMQDIKEKKFDEATLLLNQLDWTVTEDREKNILDDVIKHKDKYQDKRDYWENKKATLEQLIEQTKNQQ